MLISLLVWGLASCNSSLDCAALLFLMNWNATNPWELQKEYGGLQCLNSCINSEAFIFLNIDCSTFIQCNKQLASTMINWTMSNLAGAGRFSSGDSSNGFSTRVGISFHQIFICCG